MAKKKFTFSQIGELITKVTSKTSIIVENNLTGVEQISTGNYILNALFSTSIFGGLSSNNIFALAGEEAVGKSFLCYNIIREAQKKDWNIIFIDTENSISAEKLAPFGIDVANKFKLIRSNIVEDLKIFLAQMLSSLKEAKHAGFDIDKTMIFIDSWGMLGSRKEVEDAIAGKDKADMTRAKALNSLLRVVTHDLGYLNIPLIITNHTYKTQDLFPKDIMKGGQGLYYSASTIVFLSKAKLKTGQEGELEDQSGIIVTAKTKKHRSAKLKKVKFKISTDEGMNPYNGLEYFCSPENFEEVGIAVGKAEVDSEGEFTFKPGGKKWYVRHLNKSVWEKELFTSEVFTTEVLNKLEPIIKDYFRYKTYEEAQEAYTKMKEMEAEYKKSLDALESNDDVNIDILKEDLLE